MFGEILDRFQMKNCNPASTPTKIGLKLVKDPVGRKIDNILYKQIMESLIYLTITRPNVIHLVKLINRYIECLKEIHLMAIKRILHYLKGTSHYRLLYEKGKRSDLTGFTDSNYVGDHNDHKSTSGYIFISSLGAVSWSSKK